MRTRDRIIDTARRLFNRLHYAHVTTAMLAAEVGIAEGNLWYHFKTKRDLLEALSEQFIARNKARLAIVPDHADVLASYVFLAMREAGLLDIEDTEIDDLATNAIIVIRYQLEYLRESGQAETEGSGAVTRGIKQHLTLFSHRLTPAAKAELERRIGVLSSNGLKIGDACVM